MWLSKAIIMTNNVSENYNVQHVPSRKNNPLFTTRGQYKSIWEKDWFNREEWMYKTRKWLFQEVINKPSQLWGTTKSQLDWATSSVHLKVRNTLFTLRIQSEKFKHFFTPQNKLTEIILVLRKMVLVVTAETFKERMNTFCLVHNFKPLAIKFILQATKRCEPWNLLFIQSSPWEQNPLL